MRRASRSALRLVMALAAVLPSLSGTAEAGEGATDKTAAVPLGRSHYAMAVGGLRASSTENWVRLGQYTFAADGTVSERHWHWTQQRRVDRSDTEFTAAGCTSRDCVVKTANGYQSTGAARTLTGTWTVSGQTLRVRWDSGLWESWALTETADGALGVAELTGSSFGATHGFGNGSTAAWNARVPMPEIAAADHSRFTHRYHLWKTTSPNPDPHLDNGDGAPFWVRDWSLCTGGSCLGAQTSLPTLYYVSPANSPTGHRRDTLWHWQRSLADNRNEYCYKGNSHVKPMIQVVDDEGGFRGWVGVEASLNQSTQQGALADDIGIFRITG